ncbi:MAG: hypothetical protein ACOCZ7_03060, partial [Armatimonadota bacterium]
MTHGGGLEARPTWTRVDGSPRFFISRGQLSGRSPSARASRPRTSLQADRPKSTSEVAIVDGQQMWQPDIETMPRDEVLQV